MKKKPHSYYQVPYTYNKWYKWFLINTVIYVSIAKTDRQPFFSPSLRPRGIEKKPNLPCADKAI